MKSLKGNSYNFLSWYYGPAKNALLDIFESIILIIFNSFSIPILLKNLFQPWKKDVTRPVNPSLSQIWQALVMNLIARLIGFVVRFFTILIGLIFSILAIAIEIICFILAMILPLPVSLILIFIYFYFHFTWQFSTTTATVLLLSIAFSTLIAFLLYIKYGKKNPPLKQSLKIAAIKLKTGQKIDLYDYLDYQSAKIINSCNNFATFQKLIFDNDKVRYILLKAGFIAKVFTNLPPLSEKFPGPLLQNAMELAIKMGHKRIESGDLFVSYIKNYPLLLGFFEKYNLMIEDFDNILYWQTSLWSSLYSPSPLLNPKSLRLDGGFAKEWQAGYTPLLSRFSTDLTKTIQTYPNYLHFQAHNKEILEIEQILGRMTKNNVLLIGDPGIGKKTLVYGLARDILFGKTLKSLQYKKIIEVDLATLLSAASNPDEAEKLIVTILEEAVSAGNVILFIDGIEKVLNQPGGKLGTVSAGEIFIQFFHRNDFQLVTTTDYSSYHKYIEKDTGIQNMLEVIEVSEPDDNQTLLILEEITPTLEAKNNVLVTYLALKEIVKQAKKYLPNAKFPEKAIDFLDEATVYLGTRTTDKILLPSHIDQLIASKTHIPIGEVKKAEKEKLLNLETILHKRLVNQDEAVNAIAQALRRARAGLQKGNRPIGSFLFLGPTGVGKTETAKTLAQAYFTNEKNMIRLDMSEYQQITDLEKLIGSDISEGYLTSHVTERPFSLILLDEIEKAHPDILNLFLQVLDEGKLKDFSGRQINFENTIIIGTSNAGAEFIRENIQAGKKIADFRQQFIDLLLQKGIFKPEFINRFDAVVAFRPLSEDELVQVVGILESRLNDRLKEQQISIKLADDTKRKLAKLGFDPQFGARALARTMTEKIENLIAKMILEGSLGKGQTLEITAEMI